MTETDVEMIIEQIHSDKPELVIIDSIQTTVSYTHLMSSIRNHRLTINRKNSDFVLLLSCLLYTSSYMHQFCLFSIF